jgi:hypothetical protein
MKKITRKKRYDKTDRRAVIRKRYKDKTARAGILVGRTPKERLNWLLEFAQRIDLAIVDRNALKEALAEINYFAAGSGADFSPRIALQELHATELDSFAIFVRLGLASLFEGKTWDLRLLPASEKAFSFVRSLRRLEQGDSVEAQYISTDVLTIARWRAQELVGSSFGSIGRCRREACRKFFAVTKRQEYCSIRCSQIERTAKWRQGNPRKAQQLRHEIYKRKVAKEKGAAAAKHVRSRIGEDTTR